MKQTLVLGLGNPILTDDAVGIRVAEAVAAALGPERLGNMVTVDTAGLGGLALMEQLLGYERAILIDALAIGNQTPGRLLRLSLADLAGLRPTAHSLSPHDTSLGVALELGRQMGLPLPDEITIYAITVSQVLDFGAEPTPAVAAVIPAATAAVLTELT